MRRHASAAVFAATLMLIGPFGRNVAHAQEVSPHTSDVDLVQGYRVMQSVTMGMLGATAMVGLVQLYNLPTSFGDGACASNQGILGSYACNRSFSLVHGLLGIASIATYVATAVLAVVAPDVNQSPQEHDVTVGLG